MTTPKYIIEYQSIDNIEYPNASGMKRYLKEQKSIWAPLLEEVKNNNQLKNIPGQHGNTNAETLAKSFDTLINGLEDPNNFNRLTTRHRGGFIVPPPANSIEGQLILGLFTNGRKQDAVAAFLAFVSKTIGINQNPNQPIGRLVDRGEDLTIAAYAAEAVPFRNVTSQKLNGAVRSAENHSQSLGPVDNHLDAMSAATRFQPAA